MPRARFGNSDAPRAPSDFGAHEITSVRDARAYEREVYGEIESQLRKKGRAAVEGTLKNTQQDVSEWKARITELGKYVPPSMHDDLRESQVQVRIIQAVLAAARR